MKLEVGKSYRTRSGSRVDIVSVLENDNLCYPAIGWRYREGLLPSSITFTSVGSFVSDFVEHSEDLIEELEASKFAVNSIGEYVCRDGKTVIVLHILPSAYDEPVKGFKECSVTYLSWNKDGSFFGSGSESNYDLVRKK